MASFTGRRICCKIAVITIIDRALDTLELIVEIPSTLAVIANSILLTAVAVLSESRAGLTLKLIEIVSIFAFIALTRLGLVAVDTVGIIAVDVKGCPEKVVLLD